MDHLFSGVSDKTPVLNPDEVVEWKYIAGDDLRKQIKNSPELFTVWFKICLDKKLF